MIDTVASTVLNIPKDTLMDVTSYFWALMIDDTYTLHYRYSVLLAFWLLEVMKSTKVQTLGKLRMRDTANSCALLE